MDIEKLEYFWGLYSDPESADAAGADTHIVYEAPDVPEVVHESFEIERIDQLRGQFGLPGVGDPEQVDFLKIAADGETWEVRVLNRAITLAFKDDEEVRRLHRFFGTIGDESRRAPR